MTNGNEQPPAISESWMTGYCFDSTLNAPIIAARIELLIASATEDFCRAVWDLIVARLDEWKRRHGSPPDRAMSVGLLGINRWDGLADDDVPAYGWSPFESFAALIRHLIDGNYEPIVEVQARVSPKLFWAVVTLAEAVAQNSGGAVLAYSYLESARRQELLDHSAAMAADMKIIAPLLERSAKFLRTGRPPGAVDGLSKLLDRLLAEHPDISTMDAWRRLPEFAPDEITELDSDKLEWTRSGSKSIPVSMSSGAFEARMTDARKRRQRRDK
jgi:hypothetical protein